MGEMTVRTSSKTLGEAYPQKLWYLPEGSTWCLFGSCVLWAMIYDTIYAQQDLEDDMKAGIRSLAVHYRGQTKRLLTVLLSAMVALLVLGGRQSNMGYLYYLLSVCGPMASLGSMIVMVNLNDSASCWTWFSKGFWLTGGAITAGLLGEYLVQSRSNI